MPQRSKFFRSVRAFTREFLRERKPLAQAIFKRPLVGVALGGGFARGMAHIGVLKVLEENHVPIDFIAGTSVGSVIAAAYASGISAKELEEVAGLVRMRDFARWTISLLGFASNARMASFLPKFLKVQTFEECRIPLAVAATDFVTGDGAVFRRGNLIDPVRASCAYPGMFLPVSIEGRLYVDGMLAHAVPTQPLREMGAERVLAVYLSAHWVNMKGPRHVFDVIGQCFSIAQAKMCGLWQSAADVILTPDVHGFSYDAFDRTRELVCAGETAAREALPSILQWLGTESPATDKAASATPVAPPVVATKPQAA